VILPTTSSRVRTAELHPRFRARLEAFFRHPEIAGKVKIVSGVRTIADQRRLYDLYKRGRGNLAANPDRQLANGFRGSYHMQQNAPGCDGYGMAVDLRITGRGLTWARLHQIIRTFGMRPTVRSENWHMQPGRMGGGRFEWFAYTAGREKPFQADTRSELEKIAAYIAELRRTVLRRGDRGHHVASLQRFLADQSFPAGRADGHFGRKTEKAVRMLQTDAGLTVDGIVGPNTWNALLGA
jgi:hypothetical protein